MCHRFVRLMICCVLLAGFPARAQSYQTSFSGVKFDRARGPATFAGGVEVDAASGAASLTIPFGPGIGERGLKFRPVLSMRMAPQLGISSVDENVLLMTLASGAEYWTTNTVDTLYQRGFGSASFAPGTLDLGTMVSTVDRHQTSYNLPGGGGGRILGQVPPSLSQTDVQTLLTRFGFGSGDTVGFLPGQIGRTNRVPAIQMGSDGSLVVGLRVAGASSVLTDEVSDDIQDNPASLYKWDFPRRVVVIQGDVAYEFHYVDHSYMTRVIPYLAIDQKTQLYQAHYVLTKIRNRFNESIDFTYDVDGIGYTATWSTNPAVKIRVAMVGTFPAPPGQKWLSDSRFELSNVTRLEVDYQGVSQPVSTYLLDASDPQTGGALPLGSGGPASSGGTAPNGQRESDMVAWGASVASLQPVRVVQVATNEEIAFGYGVGPSTTWGGLTVTPTVLNRVAFPTRTVSLVWDPYRFRMNYSPEAWGGVVSSSSSTRPAYAYGVVTINDSDGTQARQSKHARVVPTSNWSNAPLGSTPPDQWVDTTFYDAITHPDGSVSVHRFVSPPTINAMTGASGMQNLAFIKTLEREVRYYEPGVDWQSDLAVTDPASSSAYQWVVKDRFDVRTVGSPGGDLLQQAVPYPTRIRTWDRDTHVFTVEETTDWDPAAFGWKTVHRTSSLQAAPSMAMDYLSLAQQGASYTEYPASQGIYRRTDRTFDTNLAEWLFGREKTEQATLVHDNTGFLAPGASLPDIQPLLTKTFNSSINRVEAIELMGSDGLAVTTRFGYLGTSGLEASELLNAYLSSPGMLLSDQMGVSAYAYDANGYLSSISQKPNATTLLTLQQAQDELGRPMSQTDMNGKVQAFGWDQAGRLASLTPPDGEESTTITYDDTDHRGITVTRGQQVTEYRYNGFGERVLERRKAPDGTWSHRIHGYDAAGRQTGETIWLPGDGAADEAKWALPYLTKGYQKTAPEQTICRQWGVDVDGNAVCLNWQTILASTTSWNALFVGSSVTYDGRGRVSTTVDPNGLKAQTDHLGAATLPPGITSYVGPVRRVTLAPGTGEDQVTWYESDAAGRLIRVTDALNQRTEYRYDGGGRIGEVRQYDGAGHVQTRSWTYNRLGWLTSLSQPESGTTSYSTFTVSGNPTVTSYAGRIIRMTPDWMGRPQRVVADDGSVSQTFTYDTAVGGAGKLASTEDGAVTTRFSYGAPGGRLDSLVTVAGQQSFTQSFGYDSYGQRTSGNTSHAAWTQTFHPATGLPDQLAYGGTSVASAPWTSYDATSWAIRTIQYGNGAVSSFDYDSDQTRLHQIVHGLSSGGPLAQWVYQYDKVGNLYRENDLVTGSFDQYLYDGLNRLVSALVQSPTYGDQQQAFAYDAFGNRTSSALVGVTGWSDARGTSTPVTAVSAVLGDPNRKVANTTFDPSNAALWQKNQLPATTSAGALTGAVYDPQGNLVQVFERPGDARRTLTMAYDTLGRVTALGRPDGTSERYGYTAEGLRTLIEEWQGQTLVRRRYNLYNDGRQLVSQYEEVLSGGLIESGALPSLAAGTTETPMKTSANAKAQPNPASKAGADPVITSPSGPITVHVDQAVMFSGRSNQGNRAAWTFGDGANARGWNTSHTYGAAGTYLVTFSIRVPAHAHGRRWGHADVQDPARSEHPTGWVTRTATVTITVLPKAPVITTFMASPTTIPIGEGSTLNWSVSGADTVTLSEGAVGASGGRTVFPSAETRYTLVASNAGGTTRATVTVHVVQAPVISSFGANPGSVYQGDPSTLGWAVSGATALSLDQGIGSVFGTSTRPVNPSGTTTYTLTAVNSLNGVSVTRTAATTVTVTPRPTVPVIGSFTADAASVGAGAGTTLRWNVTNSVGAVAVTLSSVGTVAQSGTQWVVPAGTTTYTLTATNTLDPTKVVSANVVVTVVQMPVITFGASATSLNEGNSATLDWSITNAPTSVSLDQGIGAAGASGSLAVTPLTTTTYTLTASNQGGTATAQVTITVTQKPVILSFSASPPGITKGRSSVLTWSSQGGTSTTLNGQAMTGTSAVVAPSTSQSYTLVVTNSAGSATTQVDVSVSETGALIWKRDIVYLGTLEAAEFDSAGIHVTQVDHLGSPRLVTGAGGLVESRQKYLPFGELLEQTGPYTPTKGYTNHEQTDTSGLIYMQARFYVPWFGRFASPDPARDQHFEETQSWNIYSYVRNSPIMSVDPTGMTTEGNGITQAVGGAEGDFTNRKKNEAQSGGIHTDSDGVVRYMDTVGGNNNVFKHNVTSKQFLDPVGGGFNLGLGTKVGTLPDNTSVQPGDTLNLGALRGGGEKRKLLLVTMTLGEGTPYGHGRQTPGATGQFDCSGFVKWAFRGAGVKLNLGPGTSGATQIINGAGVRKITNPVAGDLAYWSKPYPHIMIVSGPGMVYGASKPGISIQERPERYFGRPTYYRVGALGE